MERYEFDGYGDRLVENLHLPQGDAHGVAILTGPLTALVPDTWRGQSPKAAGICRGCRILRPGNRTSTPVAFF
jgi:hypothetical protein